MTLAGAFLYRTVAHEGLLGKVFEDLFGENAIKVSEHVLHSVRDTLKAGKLPSNHDLRRAALDSFEKAGIVLADAVACELDPKLRAHSWSQRLRRRLIAADLMTDGSSPEMAWVQNLIAALKTEENLSAFGDAVLQVGEDSTGLLDATVDAALASELHKQFAQWATKHAGDHHRPKCFEDFVLKGWRVEQGTLTLYQIYCLFFREHIKHDPAVFGIFTGNTLALIQQQLHELGQAKPWDQARLTESLRRELTTALDRQLGDLREWLDTQLSQIQEALEGIAETQKQHTESLRRLEQRAAQAEELLRQLLPSATPLQDKITAEFPSHIKALFDEARDLVTEGRYGQAKDKLTAARQAAETDECQAAILHARVEMAEAELFEQTNVEAARDALRDCLRVAPEERHWEQRQSILSLLGDAQSLLGNFEEAKSVFRSARELARKHKNRFAEGYSLIGASHAEEMLGDLKEAHSLLDEAARLFRDECREANGDDLRRAKINLAGVLSTKALLLRREAKAADALVSVSRAVDLFREVKSFDNLGRSLLLRAELLLNGGNREVGHKVLLEALSTFESIGNIRWQCRCLEDLARFCLTNGDHKLAATFIARALELAVSGRPEIEAVSYCLQLANLCLDLDEPDKALELIRHAKNISTSAGEDHLIAECLVAEARTIKGKDGRAAREGLFKQAIQHLEFARSNCEVKGQRAVFTQQIGDLCGWLDQIHEARTCFEQALHEFEELGDATGQSRCLVMLAAIAREEQSPDDAAKAFERVIAFTEGKPLYHARAVAFHDLGMLRLAQGNLTEAKHNLDLAKSLAEKHGFRDVLETLEASRPELERKERLQEPPQRDLPSLIRELHGWCGRYPKMREAILPVWYHLHHTEIWSLCRSMLGVKFLICTKDSAKFTAIANALRRQGDFYGWGVNFIPKKDRNVDVIPYPKDFLIPAGAVFAGFRKETQLTLEEQGKALVKAINEKGCLFTVGDDGPTVVNKRIRFAPMAYKMMMETPSDELISENRICLPLRESDINPDLAASMKAAQETGMIPVLREHLPHSGGITAVCDVSLKIPNSTAAIENLQTIAATAKDLWLKLVASCPAAPQSALVDFAKAMTTLVDGLDSQHRMAARVYALRFHAGTREVVHPAVVLNAQSNTATG